jgi:hypothetical protein
VGKGVTVDKYIVAYVPTGTGDLEHEEFKTYVSAKAFVTGDEGDGVSGLDFDIEDDKAMIIGPDGVVEVFT